MQHVEQELRVNGLGASEDVAIDPFNKLQTTTIENEDGQSKQGKKTLYSSKNGNLRAQCWKLTQDP